MEEDEELYDDVSVAQTEKPPSLPSRPAKLPPVPAVETSTPSGK